MTAIATTIPITAITPPIAARRPPCTPVQIGADTDWTSVGVSAATIAGLRAGGSALLWGNNRNGQVGLAQLGDVMQPAPLSGTVTGWSQLAAGNGHSCGITGGKLYCWGTSADGNLGDGSVGNLYAPTRIGADAWSSVVTGSGGTCGVRSTDSALLCWGYNASGLGFGNVDPVVGPTRLGTATWTSVGSAISTTSGTFCGTRAGAVVCWGDNASGQIGIGNTVSPQLAPVATSTPAGAIWTEVSTGNHSCAITNNGQLSCWGDNSSGQLGNGTHAPTPVTTPSAMINGVWLHVATADLFGPMGPAGLTCGIQTDHTLWCWGLDPTTGMEQDSPTQVNAETDWAAIAISDRSLCAIKANGALFCRGEFIGDGTAVPSPTLTRVGGPALNWKAISVGNEHCGVRGDGTLWCWGNDVGFPLGDGSTGVADPVNQSVPPTLSPTQIGTDTDWASVSARGGTTCPTKTDGSLWCWGFNAAITPQIKTAPVLIN